MDKAIKFTKKIDCWKKTLCSVWKKLGLISRSVSQFLCLLFSGNESKEGEWLSKQAKKPKKARGRPPKSTKTTAQQTEPSTPKPVKPVQQEPPAADDDDDDISSGSGEWTQEEQAPLSSVKKTSHKEGGESSEQKREQQKRKRDEALQSDEEREDDKEDDDDRDFERWRSLLCLPQWDATTRGGTSRSHTSNIVPRRLAERVWWTKFESSLLNICSRLSGFQSSLLLTYFRDGPNRCSLHQSVAQNLSDMWRSTFEIGRPGAASPRDIAPSQPFLCVNRGPMGYDFRGGAKSNRYSVILNTAEIIDQLLT